MQIVLNGELTTIADGSTIADLLASRDIPAAGTAVARNDAVVRKALHAEAVLVEGDRVEIIRAVAGG